MNFNWSQTYAPAECERGKYVPIDTASLSSLGYPLSGRGKYAELVYITNDTTSSGVVSAVIVAPISLNGVISADLIEVDNLWFTTPVSANIIQSIPLSTYVVNQSPTLLSNSSVLSSIILTPNTSSVMAFTPKIDTIEIFNNTGSSIVYVDFNTTNFVDLTSKGLPILEETYYSIDREITQVTIGTVGTSDVRVVGHRRI